jgi:hypothetical protein
VEQVAQFAIAGLKAKLVSFGGAVKRLKIKASEAV